MDCQNLQDEMNASDLNEIGIFLFFQLNKIFLL